ncbi:MAG: rod shape-determining protein [Bdellovibrionaceae bacterium]|nr:rod shape-determining protein [Pseudobdellovibrionaceae bacterium]
MFKWLFNSDKTNTNPKAKYGADIYVDLGTANTLISARGKGLVLNEPSEVMISDIDPKKRKVLGVGTEGRAIYDKNPGYVSIVKPVKDGVIADFEATGYMLKHFLSKVITNLSFSRPKVIVSLPYGVTDVEKKAVIEACRSAGASRTYLIDEPMAAAIGAGINVRAAQGQMIIDIGGGSTEIAIIALSNIVYCEPLRLGGHKFDEAIIRYLKDTKKIVVTEAQAEILKVHLSTAMPKKNIHSMEIEARDIGTGFYKKVIISSEEIGIALSDSIQLIVHGVLNAIENTPPELVSDIIDSGITLAGGGALIKEISAKLETEIRIPVRIAADPLTAIARGGEMLLSDPELLDTIQIEV